MEKGSGSSSGSGSGSSSSSASVSSSSSGSCSTSVSGSSSSSASGSSSSSASDPATTTKTNNAIRALVVDDDTLIRKLHGRILEKVFKIEDCVQAKDGQQALDLHAADGHKFDLILMDFQMPNMDGIQATKNLREMGITSIIIGVSSEENAEQRFKDAGANRYVKKPLTADKLKPILEEFKLI